MHCLNILTELIESLFGVSDCKHVRTAKLDCRRIIVTKFLEQIASPCSLPLFSGRIRYATSNSVAPQ